MENSIEYQKYIVYDFECDTSTLTHIPNHVEADVIITEPSHDYNECVKEQFSHSGYDTLNVFCSWLFQKTHANSTVIAHNQSGYDGRFIFQVVSSPWSKTNKIH